MGISKNRLTDFGGAVNPLTKNWRFLTVNVFTQHSLEGIEAKISGINHSYDEFMGLGLTDRNRVNTERAEIVKALAEKVIVYPDGNIKIRGIIDSKIEMSKSAGVR